MRIASKLPGTCVVCGSPGGDGRKFVDIDFDIEFYGAVYFCTNCTGELVAALGCALPEQVEVLNTELEVLKSQRLEARNKEKLVDDFLVDLFSLGAMYRTSVDHLINSTTSDENNSESDESINEESGIDPFSVELDSVERPDDLSSTSSRKSTGALEL